MRSGGQVTRGALSRDAAVGRTFDAVTIVKDVAACEAPCVGVDLTRRWHAATMPCIVEHRRHATRHGLNIDAALWFVAAALRGAVGAHAIGGHDTHRTPIAAHEIVSVRAIGTQAEWIAECRHR